MGTIMDIFFILLLILGICWASYSIYQIFKDNQKEQALLKEIAETIKDLRKEVDELKKSSS